jgi:hypothetical protein
MVTQYLHPLWHRLRPHLTHPLHFHYPLHFHFHSQLNLAALLMVVLHHILSPSEIVITQPLLILLIHHIFLVDTI